LTVRYGFAISAGTIFQLYSGITRSLDVERNSKILGVSFSLLLICLISIPAQAEDFSTDGQNVITNITAPQLKQVLGEIGFIGVEIDEDEDLIFSIEGTRVLLLISTDKDILQFRISWSETDATLRKVNDWNRDKRFSRAYIDDDGEPVLELDLDLTGGVTIDRLVDYIMTTKFSIASFREEVL
jgi:hypothetical protein